MSRCEPWSCANANPRRSYSRIADVLRGSTCSSTLTRRAFAASMTACSSLEPNPLFRARWAMQMSATSSGSSFERYSRPTGCPADSMIENRPAGNMLTKWRCWSSNWLSRKLRLASSDHGIGASSSARDSRYNSISHGMSSLRACRNTIPNSASDSGVENRFSACGKVGSIKGAN